ncbi:MAG: succinate dehydrogenase, hydrophobic membrane anchor protein [Gammaproteobacteria bacterium]|nr:succinate dehydrogenase, hydrophobic membrane anchor protein [Gammaproteobacteria bacterium]
MKNPLARVKGSGASGEGSHHWWLQRVTALVLVPLVVWFMFSIVGQVGKDLETVRTWIAQPHVAVLLVLSLSLMFYHGQLGMQVIIDDYVHRSGLRLCCLRVTRVVLLVSGFAGAFAVLRIALS